MKASPNEENAIAGSPGKALMTTLEIMEVKKPIDVIQTAKKSNPGRNGINLPDGP